MRHLRAILMAGLLWTSAPVSAQETAADMEESSEVHVDSESGARYRLARPEPGPKRGRWSVPSWVVMAGGIALGIGAAAALIRIMVKRR